MAVLTFRTYIPTKFHMLSTRHRVFSFIRTDPSLRKILKDESNIEEANKMQLDSYWHTICMLFLKLKTKNASFISSILV